LCFSLQFFFLLLISTSSLLFTFYCFLSPYSLCLWLSLFFTIFVITCLIVSLSTPWYDTELNGTLFYPNYDSFNRTYQMHAFYIDLDCKGSCENQNLHGNWTMGKYSWQNYCSTFSSDCNTHGLYIAVWVLCLISLLLVALSTVIQFIIYLGAKKDIVTTRVIKNC